MSTSKRNALATAVEDQKSDKKDKERTPQLEKTMEDLPPEVVTIILENLTLNETKNTTLSYRLVNHQWKDIVDSLISKRIVSGDFQAFPEMKIFGAGLQRRRQCSKLHVWINTNSEMFRENSTPFNSLLLTGSKNMEEFRDTPRPRIPMTLRELLSTFGGALTTFALHDQRISINNLAALLGSVPTLKMLKLMDVKQPSSLIKPPTLATAPPLPKLTTLEVKSSSYGAVKGIANIVYVWLMASYADQLVSLILDTVEWLPPLRKGHKYGHPLRNHNQFAIAITSDLAFKKLKQLKILYPSLEFLQLSETPALQQLSVNGLDIEDQIELQHVIQFAVKYGGTLEKLYLDISWDELVSNEELGIRQHLPAGFVIPKLKTLAIRYPSNDFQERTLSEELLVMFPALNILHLLHLQPHQLDRGIAIEELGEDENEVRKDADDLVALKRQFAILTEQMEQVKRNATEARIRAGLLGGYYQAVLGREPDVDEAAQRNPEQVMDDLDRVSIIARNDRDLVFLQLAALAEKRKKVFVEQLLERRGIWNACPNLKMVTASSDGKPEGDIFVNRRMHIA